MQAILPFKGVVRTLTNPYCHIRSSVVDGNMDLRSTVWKDVCQVAGLTSSLSSCFSFYFTVSSNSFPFTSLNSLLEPVLYVHRRYGRFWSHSLPSLSVSWFSPYNSVHSGFAEVELPCLGLSLMERTRVFGGACHAPAISLLRSERDHSSYSILLLPFPNLFIASASNENV